VLKTQVLKSQVLKSQVIRLVCVAAALQLSACASDKDSAKLLNPDPPDKMYSSADTALQKGNWQTAARKFEDLDRDHPYSQEARRAIVMAAFAYYKAGKFPEAIATAQRYTTMHPGTKEAALAHHIIASAHFDGIKDPQRDQTATRKALVELKTLVQRYPESPYSRQAENRLRIAEDVLAASEMNVGRYYQKANNQVAAINRFKVVATEYQTTAHVEEALFRLVESNMTLGIVPEAQAAGAVLGHNFPNSTWYKDAHALLKNGGVAPQSGGWLQSAWKSVLPGAQQAKPSVVTQPVPEGLPSPDQMPKPAAPASSDIPTASNAKPKQMGLGVAPVASGSTVAAR
jgi:outer membrane protein assembly factor BamD